MKTGIKIVLNVLLIAIVIVLGFKLYTSIITPIKFDSAYTKRSNVVKDKMMKIREVELAYLNKYAEYTSDFDTLLLFIKEDSLDIPKSYGIVPDSIIYSSKNRLEAEKRALDLGIITRDTIRVSVSDSLFKSYDVDTLPFVPYTNLKHKFQLNAGTIRTVSKSTRPVFELKVHNNSFSEGLAKQEIININDAARDNDEFPGYIIGSMNEVTTAGNWD